MVTALEEMPDEDNGSVPPPPVADPLWGLSDPWHQSRRVRSRPASSSWQRAASSSSSWGSWQRVGYAESAASG
eukprot:12906694-Alexandrium_andersonii.AAC.1